MLENLKGGTFRNRQLPFNSLSYHTNPIQKAVLHIKKKIEKIKYVSQICFSNLFGSITLFLLYFEYLVAKYCLDAYLIDCEKFLLMVIFSFLSVVCNAQINH